MYILKILVQIVAIMVFILSAMIVREDTFNDNKAATVALCCSMALLMIME